MIRHRGRWWWYGTSCWDVNCYRWRGLLTEPRLWTDRSSIPQRDAAAVSRPRIGCPSSPHESVAYCARSTVAGSVDAARRAGSQAAATAVRMSVIATSA